MFLGVQKYPLEIFIILIIVFCDADAHQEVVIPFSDGRLHNLPERYSPAEFSMDERKVKIGDKVLVLPESISRLLIDCLPHDLEEGNAEIENSLKFSASWNHGPSVMPPYLVMKIEPKGENFLLEIRIDLESVTIMSASAVIKTRKDRVIIIPVEFIQRKVIEHKDSGSIIGVWRSGDTIIRFSEDQVEASVGGELVDYPSGKIKSDKPGVMTMTTSSGKVEQFSYNVVGDILQVSFDRSGGIYLARMDSKADDLWRSLAEFE